MTTIWKYPIEVTDTQTIEMPIGAQMLVVQAQYTVYTFGTGHPANVEGHIYLGTYQLYEGGLVFHVFTPA